MFGSRPLHAVLKGTVSALKARVTAVAATTTCTEMIKKRRNWTHRKQRCALLFRQSAILLCYRAKCYLTCRERDKELITENTCTAVSSQDTQFGNNTTPQ